MALIEIRGLRVSYGRVEALHGVDMDIEEGRITAVIGSNGAGKTTILNAISGVVRRGGSIVYAGQPLPTQSFRVLRRARIAQVPEGRQVLAGLTVEENLRLGAYVCRAGETRGLLEEQFQMFPRLGERRHQDAGTLSGGEQQMLAICRALMSKPRVLLLDEPSLGLAPIIVSSVMETIQQIRDRGITVVLVEQNAKKSLSICDHAYVIENGRVVMQGSGEELLHNPDVASAYLGSGRQ